MSRSLCTRGGGGLPQCMLGYTPPPDQADPPRNRHHPPPWTRQTPPDQAGQPPPPGADTPQTRQTPPGSRLQHTVYERPVRILLECILVFLVFATRAKCHWFLCLVRENKKQYVLSLPSCLLMSQDHYLFLNRLIHCKDVNTDSWIFVTYLTY